MQIISKYKKGFRRKPIDFCKSVSQTKVIAVFSFMLRSGGLIVEIENEGNKKRSRIKGWKESMPLTIAVYHKLRKPHHI